MLSAKGSELEESEIWLGFGVFQRDGLPSGIPQVIIKLAGSQLVSSATDFSGLMLGADCTQRKLAPQGPCQCDLLAPVCRPIGSSYV